MVIGVCAVSWPVREVLPMTGLTGMRELARQTTGHATWLIRFRHVATPGRG